MSNQYTRRYPWAPLEELLVTRLHPIEARRLNGIREPDPTGAAKADFLGIHYRQLYRLIAGGVDEWDADRFSSRLGRLPWEIWPEWLEDTEGFRAYPAEVKARRVVADMLDRRNAA